MKNVLILSSSPRKGGNSDLLCDRFQAGAESAGHRVEKIFLMGIDKNWKEKIDIKYKTGFETKEKFLEKCLTDI